MTSVGRLGTVVVCEATLEIPTIRPVRIIVWRAGGTDASLTRKEAHDVGTRRIGEDLSQVGTGGLPAGRREVVDEKDEGPASFEDKWCWGWGNTTLPRA